MIPICIMLKSLKTNIFSAGKLSLCIDKVKAYASVFSSALQLIQLRISIDAEDAYNSFIDGNTAMNDTKQ